MNELLHLLTDPAHWAFEGITDVVYGGLGALIGSWWVRRHDRKHHDNGVIGVLQDRITALEDRLPYECGWCGSSTCDH